MTMIIKFCLCEKKIILERDYRPSLPQFFNFLITKMTNKDVNNGTVYCEWGLYL